MATAKKRRRRSAPDLSARWNYIWRRIGGDASGAAAYADLARRYEEIHRHHHRLSHIGHCLSTFDQVRDLAADPDAVELAIWFHRAVFFTDSERFAVNLQFSAGLAVQTLRNGGVDHLLTLDVASLIRSLNADTVERDNDEQLLADIERSIFHASDARFDEYEALVRREYSWIPDSAWLDVRAVFLTRMLKRRFYQTAEFEKRFGNAARRNLQRALVRLRSGCVIK